MKLSLPRITLILSFLATLVADDDDPSIQMLDPMTSGHELHDSLVNTSSFNGKSGKKAVEDDTKQSVLDNPENDTVPNTSKRKPIQEESSDAEFGGGTEILINETTQEVLPNDSLGSTSEGIVMSDDYNSQIESDSKNSSNDSHEEMRASPIHSEESNVGTPQAETDHSLTSEMLIEENSTDYNKNNDKQNTSVSIEKDADTVISHENDTEGIIDEEKHETDIAVDYGNVSTGAIIIDKSSNFSGTKNLLLGNDDRYAISPCEGEGVKYFVVGLSEDIQVRTIKLSSHERYSSLTKKFEVLGSTTYPISSEWNRLGTFEAKPWFKENLEQSFELEQPTWMRYLKFRLLTHHGDEHYCTLSQIKVYGSTAQQDFMEQYQNIEEANLDDVGREVDDAKMEESQTINDKVRGEEKVINESENLVADTSDETGHDESELVPNTTARVTKVESSTIGLSNDDIEAKILEEVVNREKVDTHRSESMESKQTSHEGSNEDHQNRNISRDMIDNESRSSTHNDLNHPVLKSGYELTNSKAPMRKDAFLTEISPEVSALASASIKTSSSKFVKDENEDDAECLTSHSTLNMYFGLDFRSSFTSVQKIEKVKKKEITFDRDNGREASQSHKSVLERDSVSTISKVVKYAAKTMKEVSGISGIQDIINLNLIPEVVQKNKITEDTFHESNGITTKVVDRTEEDRLNELHSHTEEKTTVQLPSSSSSSLENSSKIKSESATSVKDVMNDLSQRHHIAACLDELNFQTFKAQLLKAGATGAVAGNGNLPGGTKHEPIFKKLTDEIKMLQNSQGIYDQYIKMQTSCYQQIITDLNTEISYMKVAQEKRLSSMEEHLRLLLEKNEEEAIGKSGNIMMYIDYFYRAMVPMLLATYHLSRTTFNAFSNVLYLLWLHILQNGFIQKGFQLVKLHQGEIYSFIAGSFFCLIGVTLFWFINRSKNTVEKPNTIEVIGKELNGIKMDKIGSNGKRKRRKGRKKNIPYLDPESICTSIESESSVVGIVVNSGPDNHKRT